MDEPLVSIIVPVYEDYADLEGCLSALENQTYPSERYEVVVVDNGSSESEWRDVTQSEPVRIRQFREPKYSTSAARNRGLTEAEGHIFAITDADCIPDSQWLENGVETIRDRPEVGLVAGRIEVFVEDPDNPTIAEVEQVWVTFPQRAYVEVWHFGAGANIFTRRDVVEDVGDFTAHLTSGGDAEWGNRTFDAGYELQYDPDAVVYHPARRRLSELAQKEFRRATGVFQRDRMRSSEIAAEPETDEDLQERRASAQQLRELLQGGLHRLVKFFLEEELTLRQKVAIFVAAGTKVVARNATLAWLRLSQRFDQHSDRPTG